MNNLIEILGDADYARLTALKTENILNKNGCRITGFVLTDPETGSRSIVEMGKVLWFSNEEFSSIKQKEIQNIVEGLNYTERRFISSVELVQIFEAVLETKDSYIEISDYVDIGSTDPKFEKSNLTWNRLKTWTLSHVAKMSQGELKRHCSIFLNDLSNHTIKEVVLGDDGTIFIYTNQFHYIRLRVCEFKMAPTSFEKFLK